MSNPSESYAAELDRIRTNADTRKLEARWDATCLGLIELNLTEEATALRAAQVGGPEAAHLDAIFGQIRETLLALRTKRNAEGPPDPPTGRGFVAPVNAALDRLGELWAVAPRQPSLKGGQ